MEDIKIHLQTHNQLITADNKYTICTAYVRKLTFILTVIYMYLQIICNGSSIPPAIYVYMYQNADIRNTQIMLHNCTGSEAKNLGKIQMESPPKPQGVSNAGGGK